MFTAIQGEEGRPEDNHEDMQGAHSFLNVLKDKLYFMTGGIGRL